MKRHRCTFELKAVDAGARTFEGHASIFNVPDDNSPPDIVMPGAFAKTIKEWGPAGANRIKVLAMHRWDWLPIGKPLELKEDEKGLFFKAFISETAIGNDVLTLLRDGVITEMSIGYDPVKEEFDRVAGIRRLPEVRLWEISPVTWAMHPQALIENVKDLVTHLKNPCCADGLCEDRRAEAVKSLTALLEEKEPAPATPDPAAAEQAIDPALVQSFAACTEEIKHILNTRRAA